MSGIRNIYLQKGKREVRKKLTAEAIDVKINKQKYKGNTKKKKKKEKKKEKEKRKKNSKVLFVGTFIKIAYTDKYAV